jgi:hypothetical protein
MSTLRRIWSSICTTMAASACGPAMNVDSPVVVGPPVVVEVVVLGRVVLVVVDEVALFPSEPPQAVTAIVIATSAAAKRVAMSASLDASPPDDRKAW